MKKAEIFFFSMAVLLAGCGKQLDSRIQGKVDNEAIAITTKVPGRIERLLVAEGDQVRKGDTIAILDVPEVDPKRRQALGAVTSATAQYEMTQKGATENQLIQLRAKESALQEQYLFAEKSIQRLKNMLQDSLIPQQQYDEAFVKFQGAKAQLEAARAEMDEVKNGLRREQQEMAQGQQSRALGALQEVAVAESERYIIAPADMLVETITLKVGELALPGYTLIQGALPATTFFKCTLPESELHRVKQGAKVVVYSVSAKREVEAKITHVKKLPAYADIQTAFPNYELSESLFEIKLVPLRQEDAQEIIPGTTILIQL